VPVGHFDRSTSLVASTTQAPSQVAPLESIAGYQPSAVLSTPTSRTGASITALSENPAPAVRQATANPYVAAAESERINTFGGDRR
jgi:hypothetical protein